MRVNRGSFASGINQNHTNPANSKIRTSRTSGTSNPKSPKESPMSDTGYETVETPDLPEDISHLQDDDTQLEIKLFSRLPEKFQIPADKMVVPGSMTRLDLSELINDTVSLPDRVPFDFLINGEFLRGSLSLHCNERSILSEKTLEIEYVIAMEEPDSSDLTAPEDMWISCISVGEGCFYTSTMNGIVMRYDLESGKPLGSATLSSLPLTGVASTVNGVVVTASRDGHIRFSDSSSLEVIESGKLDQGIMSLALCPFDQTLALTGTVTGAVHLWNVPVNAGAAAKKSSKKRSVVVESEPRSLLTNTNSAVSAIYWCSLSRAIIGCLDGSIHIVDPMSGHCMPVISTNRSISALTCLGPNRLVTGHPDGRVIFWHLKCDSSTSASIEALNSCRSQSRMISGLAGRPGSEFTVASGSIDGTIKLFDSRASHFAVQSVSVPAGQRVLAVEWDGENRMLSGASDGVVRSHIMKQ